MHARTKLLLAELQYLIDTVARAECCNECLLAIGDKHKELSEAILKEAKLRLELDRVVAAHCEK